MNLGREVFDPMAHLLVKLVAQDRLSEPDAVVLLSTLIDHLRGIGWDEWGDSLGEFRNIEFVVTSFSAMGRYLDGERLDQG